MSDSPTILKAKALAAARGLLNRRRGGFRFDDIALALGTEFRRGGDGERQLRRALEALKRDGALSSAGRGLIAAGSALDHAAALAPGVAMAGDLRRLFLDGGGFVRTAEAKAALDLDPAGDRRLGRALTAGGYRQAIPLRWYKDVWHLADAERLRLPLPGAWLALDTRLAIRDAGGDWTADSIRPELHERRLVIGAGVKWARLASGLDPEDILEDQDVERAFAEALANGQRNHIAGGRPQSLGSWWCGRAERMGAASALAWTWADLEGERLEPDNDLVRPVIVDAMTADFWRALGRRLGVDPVSLSRGSPAHTG